MADRDNDGTSHDTASEEATCQMCRHCHALFKFMKALLTYKIGPAYLYGKHLALITDKTHDKVSSCFAIATVLGDILCQRHQPDVLCMTATSRTTGGLTRPYTPPAHAV